MDKKDKYKVFDNVGKGRGLTLDAVASMHRNCLVNSGGGVVELKPGDSAIVFRSGDMPTIVVPRQDTPESRVTTCKVLYTLVQLQDGESITEFCEQAEESYRSFTEAWEGMSDEDKERKGMGDLDTIPNLNEVFLSPGSKEIH